MTQRSILSGASPTVIIRAGRDIKVQGWNGDRVESSADGMWGLKVERKDGVIEVGSGRGGSDMRVRQNGDAVEVSAGKDCEVRVPFNSTLKVHAGRDAEIVGVTGSVAVAHVGHDLTIHGAGSIGACAAGGSMDLEGQRVIGGELKYSTGRHLRCHIHDLTNTKFMIKDLGGYWEMSFGEPATQIWLKAGGDVTLVLDEKYSEYLPDVVGGLEIARPPQGDNPDQAPDR